MTAVKRNECGKRPGHFQQTSSAAALTKAGYLKVKDPIQQWVHHGRNHFRQLEANVQAYVWPTIGTAASRRNARRLQRSAEAVTLGQIQPSLPSRSSACWSSTLSSTAAGGAKTEALLLSLALEESRGVCRERLLSQHWPDSEPSLAAQSLHSLLHSLHRLLGDAIAGAPPVVHTAERSTGSTYERA
jgi:DNA-binding SARP family transcriptional activator